MNDLPPMPGTAGEATDEPSSSPAVPREPESRPAAPQPAEAVAAEPESPPAAPAPAPAPAATDATAPEAEHFHLPSPPAETALEAAAASPIEAPSTAPAPAPAPASAPASEPPALAPAPSAEVAAPAAKPAEAGTTSEPTPVEHGIGVLLVNLGTPDAADPAAVRRYLKEFLTDPRVIEKNSLIWKMVLNGIILPLRSRRKARDYQKIWNREKNELPLKTITRSQAEKLAGILEPLGNHVIVDWAMRYANPSIASRLQALVTRGCDRILVMPLYPQYAAATTATVCDEVFRFLMQLRRQPALRILPAYYEDPYYIEVLASSLQAELKALSFEPEVILASYHGMPKEYVRQGRSV